MGTVIIVVLFIVVIGGIVLAERSLRLQAGSSIKRSEEERRALSHIQTNATRSAGQGF